MARGVRAQRGRARRGDGRGDPGGECRCDDPSILQSVGQRDDKDETGRISDHRCPRNQAGARARGPERYAEQVDQRLRRKERLHDDTGRNGQEPGERPRYFSWRR